MFFFLSLGGRGAAAGPGQTSYRRLRTKALLRIRRQAGTSALKAPNLGLDCSFC